MSFLKFVFSFLYIRNWHTGQKELSKLRLYLFVGGLGFLLFAVIFAYWLQSPAVYTTL